MATLYVGRVSHTLEKNKCGFVGISSITKEDGSSHDLKTSHDVFVHIDDCSGLDMLNDGLTLSFECAPGRDEGKLRAVNVISVKETELVPREGPVMPGFQLVRSRHGLVVSTGRDPHAHMKDVPALIVEKVQENQPLKGLPRDEEEIRIGNDPASLISYLEGYLHRLFPSLVAFSLTFSVNGFSLETEERAIAEATQGCRDLSMEVQAKILEDEYKRFVETRKLLVWIWETGLLQPGTRMSPTALTTIVRIIEDCKDPGQKGTLVANVKSVVEFMSGRDLLQPNTVVPMRYLPELYMACPVWFFMPPQDVLRKNEWSRSWQEGDPKVTGDAQYFCGLSPSQCWTDTFLLFNRRLRTMNLYEGEIIPPHIFRLMREAATVFDYVVIMTPYHDVAGREWQDPKWQRAIDPYVVGFKKGLPVFFVIARYSGTGIFPLFEQLVADTMNYIHANRDQVKGFGVGKNPDGRAVDVAPYWWQHGKPVNSFSNLGTYLVKHVDRMHWAFQVGHLFDWLRGEWAIPEEIEADFKAGRTPPSVLATTR